MEITGRGGVDEETKKRREFYGPTLGFLFGDGSFADCLSLESFLGVLLQFFHGLVFGAISLLSDRLWTVGYAF